MNYYIFAIGSVVFVIIFTLMIMIPLCKNPIWWIHDYPKDIQEEYFKTHERIPAAPLSKTALVKKFFAVIIAIVMLTTFVWICGARTFWEGFIASYALWQIINWYDCFFLDWVLFANIKRIRLPGTEHMDKEYHQKMYHFVHALVGMALGLVVCLLTGVVTQFLGK